MAKTQPNKLTFAEITLLPQGKRYELYKASVVEPFGKVKDARQVVTDCMHTAMKVTAMLKRDYTRLMLDGELAADTSELKYFETYCGGDIPARVKQLATFCNAMGLETETPMIPEAIADAHSINTLEKAAPIIAHERKNHAEVWKTTEITLAVISALTTPGEATKKLAAIRKLQQPEEKDAEAGIVTNATLVQMVKTRILEAQINDDGYTLFKGVLELGNMWGQNTTVPNEQWGLWLTRIELEAQANAPVLLTAETPTPETLAAPAPVADQQPAELAA